MTEVFGVLGLAIFIMFIVILVSERVFSVFTAVIDFVWGLLNQ